MYTDLFPFLSAGDDENKLLAKTAVIQVIDDLECCRVVDQVGHVLNIVHCPCSSNLFQLAMQYLDMLCHVI